MNGEFETVLPQRAYQRRQLGRQAKPIASGECFATVAVRRGVCTLNWHPSLSSARLLPTESVAAGESLMRLPSIIKAQTTQGLRTAIRAVLDEMKIQRLHRRSSRKAARAYRYPVKLNLASGFRPKNEIGWVNVDLTSHADLQLDLREALPFPTGSVTEIYAEHFLEHLSYPNLDDAAGWEIETNERRSPVLSLLRECRRVLVAGGTLDIVVPDAEQIIAQYATNRADFGSTPQWWGPSWCDTAMHRVNYVFRQGREHLYAYDEETLTAVLTAAGFVHVTRRPFDPMKDAPNHEIGSLCVVAVAPT
jgi:predicted SAM-dependent methyltransferase